MKRDHRIQLKGSQALSMMKEVMMKGMTKRTAKAKAVNEKVVVTMRTS